MWASDAAYQAAHGAAFRALVQRPEWAAFPNTPGLYQVAFEASAAEGAK
jgi:hypothetical protein